MITDKKIYFRDENYPDKKGKELTDADKKNWFWGIVCLLNLKKPEECTDEELRVQKMYTNILIF